MPRIRCLQIDAFASRPFSGNPAAVCLLDRQHDPEWMQSVAAEMNLSETAFVRPVGEGFELRWFTPAIEVDLCGHATLAAAHAIWEEGIVQDHGSIRFHTKSGLLTAIVNVDFIELDLPATPAEKAAPPAELIESLGVRPLFVGRTKFDFILVAESEAEIRALKPDFQKLKYVRTRGVIVTSVSDDPRFDFVSRFFAPAAGIDEDPVTGSAHCCLAPFWQHRLGKDKMNAYQASARGGVVQVRVAADRVILGGQAVTIWRGELSDVAGGTTESY
ncbi:MAG: PhzF family phenazine biosynthesis protein [Planctomycetia bacterium]|nr:PhzF family phenazine biosynthesis protein [Planctomycetia bacterium]